MGIIDWLASLFRITPPVRDLSLMADIGDDADVTQEKVDTQGGPLKPHHQRLALRDARLLPKKKPKLDPYVWPRPKKPKILDKQQANRLFSETMRTRNRNLRDLATDEQQLERYGLPDWKSEQDVADALGLSLTQLQHYSIHRHRETSPHYVTFAIRKRSGGHRLIHAPKSRLKAIQRKLNDLLIRRLPVSDHGHGFLRGRSIATNAAPHVGKAVVIKLDIQDCFPSIHYGRVRGLLISLGYSFPVATTLAVLMTEAVRQPVDVKGTIYHVPVGPRVCVQGAPTSPGLCNALLLRMDRRLAGLACKHGYAYTRYADDLTFSGDDLSKIKLLISIGSQIVHEEGFQINRKKTRYLRKGQRQLVTGVVVNQQVGLSRQQRRRLRAEIHQLAQSSESPDPSRLRQLAGKLAYLNMLNAEQAAPLQESFRRAVEDKA